MIIDFHTHIFPKDVREGRENHFDGEPSFKLLYDSPKSRIVGADEIVEAMDENGVDISVVFGFPWKNPDRVKAGNDYIMEAVQRHPKRLIGLSCVDPSSKGAAREVMRSLEGGLAGVGELAFYTDGINREDIDSLSPIMDICLEKNAPVLIHTNEPVGHIYPGKSPNTLVQIYDLVKRYPENKIVLAHWGGGIFFYNLLKKEVKETLKNVYFDTAASPFLYNNQIYPMAMKTAGEGKILFGSDYPLIKPSRYFKEIEESGVSPEEKGRILGENARQLLGL